MEHTKHIMRAILLLVLAVLVFIVGRHFAIPESFGDHGHFRAENVAEHAIQSPVHGPAGGCAACHDEQAKTVAENEHRSVPCETCHAPLSTHVTAGEKVADMPSFRTYRLCKRCHEQLVARPKDFPQVALPNHVVELGAEMSEDICLECHDAHDPNE